MGMEGSGWSLLEPIIGASIDVIQQSPLIAVMRFVND
jgi:hypothetical protein